MIETVPTPVSYTHLEAGKEYEVTVVVDEKGLDDAIGIESVIIRREDVYKRQILLGVSCLTGNASSFPH